MGDPGLVKGNKERGGAHLSGAGAQGLLINTESEAV